MSKYDALGAYLRGERRTEVPMTFNDIERITGTKLPPSARIRSWWSNNAFNSVMTDVWLKAGFKTEQVDMAAKRLVFRRVAAEKKPGGAAHTARHPLFGALKDFTQIAPNTDLTQPADPSWGG